MYNNLTNHRDKIMNLPCYQSFIHGQFLKSTSRTLADVINPATGKVIYQVELASEEILHNAIHSSKEGFAVWSKMNPFERSRILNNAVSIIRDRVNELATVEVEDTGKPISEATAVDIPTGADSIEFFAGISLSVLSHYQDIGEDFYYTRREPLGICSGIGAWNYPFQIACWKAGPALSCGNSMIFKPSGETPLGALKLAEIFIEAGMPKGVFNVVIGSGDVGKWLVENPDIPKISFTGQSDTGKKIMQAASKNLKKLTMELGGKSPLIIFPDVKIKDAVNAAIQANFYTQGEVCTHGTRVFVHNKIYDNFIGMLKECTEKAFIFGDPKDKKTNIGALISKKHYDNVLNYIEIGKKEGAEVLCGGTPIQPKGFEQGFFITPTVFINCTDKMTIVREEIFGPVMSVLRFEDEEEVIRRANCCEFGLAAGVFTSDIRLAHRVAKNINAGICWINSYGQSPVEMPVGGFKGSGFGKENGIHSIEEYTKLKSIYVGMNPLEDVYNI
jgi:betaine-aldehyde dehydrogenase